MNAADTHFILYSEGGWIEVTNDGSRIVRVGKTNWSGELLEELRLRPYDIFLAVPIQQMAEMGLQPIVKKNGVMKG